MSNGFLILEFSIGTQSYLNPSVFDPLDDGLDPLFVLLLFGFELVFGEYLVFDVHYQVVAYLFVEFLFLQLDAKLLFSLFLGSLCFVLFYLLLLLIVQGKLQFLSKFGMFRLERILRTAGSAWL